VKYRFDIGANVWAKSPAPNGSSFGKIATKEFDGMGRLQKQSILNGDVQSAYTRYEYPENGIQSKIYSTIVDTNNNGTPDADDEVLSENWTDGAGRMRKSRIEHPGSLGGFSGSLTEYDILGKIKRSTVPTEMNSSWNPFGDDFRGYDSNSEPVWLWTSQEYDYKGRVTREINTDGTDKLISYNGCGCAGGQITTIQGELVSREDLPNQTARRTQKIYSDILGRTYKSEVLNWNGSIYSSSTTIFNGADNPTVSRQFEGNAILNIPHQTTTTTCDGFGRLKTRHLPQQELNKSTVYNYNVDNSVQNITDARGAKVNYDYNNRGLLTEISYSVPQSSIISVPDTVTFDYDALGNRIWMQDGLGRVDYEYDVLSHLKNEKRQFNDTLLQAPLPDNSYQISYTYELNGSLSSITDPFGYQTNYEYDKTGRTKQVSSLNGGQTQEYVNDSKYRAWGSLKEVNRPSGAWGNRISWQYDSRLRISEYKIYGANDLPETGFQSFQYQYQDDGKMNRLDRSIHNNGQTTVDTVYNRKYEFDHVGRMVSAKTGNMARGEPAVDCDVPFELAYQYDKYGNVIYRNVWIHSSGQRDFEGTSTYSNNRSSYYNYDSDGRITGDHYFGNNTSAIDYKYDASGATDWVINKKIGFSYWYQQETWQDGDGRATKERIWTYNETSQIFQPKIVKYAIFSSVLGSVLTEVDENGNRNKTSVYGLGKTLGEYVRRKVSSTSSQYQEFKSIKTVDPSGAYYSRVGYRPDGIDKYVTEITPENSSLEGDSLATECGLEPPPPPLDRYDGWRFGSGSGAGDGGSCTLDGFESSCSLLANGSGIEVALGTSYYDVYTGGNHIAGGVLSTGWMPISTFSGVNGSIESITIPNETVYQAQLSGNWLGAFGLSSVSAEHGVINDGGWDTKVTSTTYGPANGTSVVNVEVISSSGMPNSLGMSNSNDPFHFFESDSKLTDVECDNKLSRIFGGVAKAMEGGLDIDGKNRKGFGHTASPRNEFAYVEQVNKKGNKFMQRNPDAGGIIHTYTDETASPLYTVPLLMPGGWISAKPYRSPSATSGDFNSGIVFDYGSVIIETVHVGTNNRNNMPSIPSNPGNQGVAIVGTIAGEGGASSVFDRKNGTISYNHTHIVFFSNKEKNLRIDPRTIFCGW
jgi:YD repeat-containing protein